MFFTYDQNNSGGFYCGPARYVIVEANSADQADALAQAHGLYFDGAGDCDCCGPRWSPSYEEPTNEPSVYDQPVREYQGWGRTSRGGVPYAQIVHLNGEVETIQ